MKNKHKGIPDIGRGVQVRYVKPDPQTIKGKSIHSIKNVFQADLFLIILKYAIIYCPVAVKPMRS